MSIFPGHQDQSNLATQLWLAGRYVQAAGLLAAAVMAGRKPRPAPALSAFTALFVLLVGSIFWWGWFPQAYDDTAGRLTAFKIAGEYVLIGLMGLSLALVAAKGSLDPRVRWLVGGSIAAMMLAELAFTEYVSVFGWINMIGHLLKIVAFYLIYVALIQMGLRSPYDVLFRSLKISEQRLRQAQRGLEQRVEERTAVLKRTVEQLEDEVRGRMEAQEALRKSEEKFRNLVERIPAVTYVAALDDRRGLLYVSPQVEHLLGYSPQEFEDQPDLLARLVHADDRARVLERVQGSSQPQVCEYRLIGRDGRECWVRDESRVIYDEASQPLLVQGFIVDITEARRANQQVEAQRLRFFSVLNRLPGYVTLRGPDGSIRFANQFYIDTFGPVQGQKCFQLQRGRPQPCADCPADRVQATGQASDWEWTSPAGQTFHTWAYRMVDVDGTQAVLKMGVDMTDQRRLEREVIEASQSERRNIGQALHDTIGQNLTGLAFLIKGLSRKLAQQAPREVAAAGQIVELVNETVSQVRAIARGLDPVGLEREGLASGLWELARQVGHVYGIPCDCQVHGSADISMEAASHLYYIAQEAVNNAAKHAHATELSLRLEFADSQVRLAIADNGTGLPQARANDKGMGLHIMRYRARAIGGSLSVGSGPNGGTVVACVAPIK
jgi:PAS domain S-box-containing protein